MIFLYLVLKVWFQYCLFCMVFFNLNIVLKHEEYIGILTVSIVKSIEEISRIIRFFLLGYIGIIGYRCILKA